MKNLLHDIHLKQAQQEQGSTMLIYMFVMAATAAVAFAAMQSISLNLESSEAHKKGKNAFYSAEVGLDLAVNDIINDFEDLIPYTESVDQAGADANGYINVANYRNYAVKYKIENPLEPFLYQTVVGNTIIYHYAYTYDIESESTSNKDSSNETVNETVRILETRLVQYFVFYGQSGNSANLELFPGPDMNSWSRIHSNADIYIGSSSYNHINLRNYDDDDNMSPHSMMAVGDIHPYKKNNGSNYAGTVRIKTLGTGLTFTSSEYEELMSTSITSSNEASEEARFNNYVLVNEESYTTPSKELFKRGDFYEQRAQAPGKKTIDGMTIIGTGGLGANLIEVFVSRPTYTDVTALILAGQSSAGNAIVGLPMPIIREVDDAFEDCREDERDVDTTDIDLYALGLWYEAYLEDQGLALAGDGMLIYTSRSPDVNFTNQDGDLQGIRLLPIDGTSSPQLSDETTLASDNPIYIHGDFNTVNTRGVALVGDAMNVLSNAFNTKSCNITQNQLYNNYRGSETTIYAALFAGHLPTAENGSNYSGGVHSYPRLHEWWTGPALNFRGSFVNLWTVNRPMTSGASAAIVIRDQPETGVGI